GEISELHVGLKGTMNALFLKDLAQKVRRGLEGRVREGRSGGGLCYGYDVVREHDARGEPIHGGRRAYANQADIVRRIFREFATGKVTEVPDLRIVDDALWQQVQARLGSIRESPRVAKARAAEFWLHRRPRHLLTGLAHCGVCGAPLAAVGKD